MSAAPLDAEQRKYEDARTMAMLVHLSWVLNFFFPFGGLIGAIVVYVTKRFDAPLVRDNARNAVNALATQAIFTGIMIVVALTVFATLFLTSGALDANRHSHANPPPQFFWLFGAYFASFIAIFLGFVIAGIAGCIGARQAWLGRVFRYPLAFPFIKDRAPV